MISVPEAGLFPEHSATGAVHERVDDVVREPVRVGRERRRRDDAHVLPMAGRRVLALRAREKPAGDGRGPRLRGQPSSGITFPRPSASRLGRSRPPTARAMLPRVLEPASPYSSASGNSPAPTASSTITHARGTGLFYGGCGHGPRTARAGGLHHRDRRARCRGHVHGDQDLPDRAEPEEGRQARRARNERRRGRAAAGSSARPSAAPPSV